MTSPSPAQRSGLQRLLGFTISSASPRAAADAYIRHLGYHLLSDGEVDAVTAAAWDAPALAGRRMVTVSASRRVGDKAFVRFIEQVPIVSAPLLGQGWNAMEVLCEDPYRLADSFSDTPFKVVIPPRPLPFDPDLHAMQVLGPSGELLYFTSLPRHKRLLDLEPADRWVDQPFIAILGGSDIDRLLRHYREMLDTPTIDPAPVNVQIVNEVFGLHADTKIRLGMVKFPRHFLFEVDEHPSVSQPRPCRPGELPQGIAMVTATHMRCTPDASTQLVVGAAGERLELYAPT